MKIIISSGSAVNEVCRAIWLFLNWAKKRYRFKVLEAKEANCKNCYRSVLIETQDKGLLNFIGSILWQSQSPFRPKHKRKNWYFELKLIEGSKEIKIDKSKIEFHSMRAPKKGGQHLNKTSSGIRAIYKPLNIEAISFDERSQYLNKKIAKERLLAKIEQLNKNNKAKSCKTIWHNSKEVKRGSVVATFEGVKFNEKIC